MNKHHLFNPSPKRHYLPCSKMAELLSDHHVIFLLIFRFEIPLGIGEKTIREVCSENNVDVDTFLFLVHFILFGDGKGQCNLLEKVDINHLIRFLGNSHNYFLEKRLPTIKKELLEAVQHTSKDVKYVIEHYFEEYAEEVHLHMKYENEVVFPYAQRLMRGELDPKYNISIFEKKHDQVEFKMLELKSILIKYTPGATEENLHQVLRDLYSCGNELRLHNAVEDYIFTPCIKELESKLQQK